MAFRSRTSRIAVSALGSRQREEGCVGGGVIRSSHYFERTKTVVDFGFGCVYYVVIRSVFYCRLQIDTGRSGLF